MTNVLLIYTGLIPSVRFCALEPLKKLDSDGQIILEHKESRKVSEEDLNKCDVLVMVRCAEDCEAEIAQKCKDAGRKLVYVLDDDLLNVPKEIDCAPYYGTKTAKGNIRRIMELCDVFWTTNSNLKDKYGEFFEKTVLIDEPFIGELHTTHKQNDKIRIGFAGSSTHTNFVNDLLAEVLEEIYNKYKEKISIEFFGLKPNFIKKVDGVYIPYMNNYSEYIQKMKERSWDIGLAPLEQNEFTACKYFNKYIEYASYGIAGVYSQVEPYTFAIKNGANGILADNTKKAWVDAIGQLIGDAELRNSISETSQAELVNIYNTDVIADKIKKETEFLCNHSTTAQITYVRKLYILSKIRIYFQAYGILTPIIIIKKLIKKIGMLF